MTWDAWDYYNNCPVCGEANYTSHGYCSDEHYLTSLNNEEKFAYLSQKAAKDAAEREREAKQVQRIISFINTHKPVYQMPADSVCFWWEDRYRPDFTDFLGRWQRNKCFCYGRVVYGDRGIWAESLLELEEAFHQKKVKIVYDIKDHLGNLVSWEDFLYYAVTACVNTEEQFLGIKNSAKEFILGRNSKIQRYSFADGLEP